MLIPDRQSLVGASLATRESLRYMHSHSSWCTRESVANAREHEPPHCHLRARGHAKTLMPSSFLLSLLSSRCFKQWPLSCDVLLGRISHDPGYGNLLLFRDLFECLIEIRRECDRRARSHRRLRLCLSL